MPEQNMYQSVVQNDYAQRIEKTIAYLNHDWAEDREAKRLKEQLEEMLKESKERDFDRASSLNYWERMEDCIERVSDMEERKWEASGYSDEVRIFESPAEREALGQSYIEAKALEQAKERVANATVSDRRKETERTETRERPLSERMIQKMQEIEKNAREMASDRGFMGRQLNIVVDKELLDFAKHVQENWGVVQEELKQRALNMVKQYHAIDKGKQVQNQSLERGFGELTQDLNYNDGPVLS